MEVWNAGQIGDSHGAYSGRNVEFAVGNKTITGPLTRSDVSLDGIYTALTVDGRRYLLVNKTPVTVF